ncbi:hypothetical protein FA13DRAFT_1795924 [Coprinellus micaceus]|uniref:Fungal-type protein kinase domain-containing protein n=1 Tax=Coprinellus micaceus TaxID=71717 RepID=A0A4Y7SXW5_COPMI|nr:hypothetical protein FA13DRAFT_1795924 [Coprinellus micaceus]
MPITLHESKAEAFRLGEGSADDSVQRAFVAISSRLLNEAAKELGDKDNGSFTDTFWDRLRQNPASRPRRSVLDVVNTWKPLFSDCSALNLSVAKGIFELKRMFTSEEERSLDSAEDADNEEGRPAKKQRCNEQPALSDSLLPLYATGAMASSSRSYVIGLVVHRFVVTVCYFDRLLVACAAPFSLKEEHPKRALTLYAMSRCDYLRAGFDPHLRALTAPKDGESRHPVEDVVGSVFEYPDTSSSPGICLKVSGVIRRPDELIGRATAVYKVQPRLPDGTFSELQTQLALEELHLRNRRC